MKRHGFTLAETLITLGIIGAVAAIIIPSFIKNYQKDVLTKQFFKSYSTLNQGFKMILASEGVEKLSDSSVFQLIGGNLINNKYKQCYFRAAGSGPQGPNCKDFYTNLKKYLKIVEIKSYDYRDNYKIKNLCMQNNVPGNILYTVIIFYDGSIMFEPEFNSEPSKNVDSDVIPFIGHFYIDTNGFKGPNQRGRDIFEFYLGDNGQIYPRGSIENGKWIYGTSNSPHILGATWKRGNFWGNCKVESSCSGNVSQGNGCAARLLEERKMNY